MLLGKFQVTTKWCQASLLRVKPDVLTFVVELPLPTLADKSLSASWYKATPVWFEEPVSFFATKTSSSSLVLPFFFSHPDIRPTFFA